jgi:hypothetical protein
MESFYVELHLHSHIRSMAACLINMLHGLQFYSNCKRRSNDVCFNFKVKEDKAVPVLN